MVLLPSLQERTYIAQEAKTQFRQNKGITSPAETEAKVNMHSHGMRDVATATHIELSLSCCGGLGKDGKSCRHQGNSSSIGVSVIKMSCLRLTHCCAVPHQAMHCIMKLRVVNTLLLNYMSCLFVQ